MTREEKAVAIEELRTLLVDSSFIYVADSSKMDVASINNFRRAAHAKGVKVKVAKNTLIKQALEHASDDKGFSKLYSILKGQTTLLISENPKAPAVLLEDFRKTSEKPTLKAAYIDSDVYIGDDKIKDLTKLRSKEEMLGEIITLLQSPIKNVVGAIKSGSSTIAGLVKALEEREG